MQAILPQPELDRIYDRLMHSEIDILEVQALFAHIHSQKLWLTTFYDALRMIDKDSGGFSDATMLLMQYDAVTSNDSTNAE